jgi:hypothetical protein
MTTSELRRKIDRFATERSLVRARLDGAEQRRTAARTRQTDLDVVQNTVQYVAARVQTNFGNHVGALVTKAMHHVFTGKRNEYFIVRFRENRGKTECELRIRTENGDEAHPFHCSGGGVWDTIAFALRCACLVLEQPPSTRMLFLDEPFKFLHGAVLRKRAMTMLYNTCSTLGIQAVVVHQSDDASDTTSGLDALDNKSDCAVYKVSLVGYEESEVKRYE